MGILSPGVGMTFRYIDFNDENDGVRKVMEIPFSKLAMLDGSEAVASKTAARP